MTSHELDRPTPDLVRQYVQRFDTNPGLSATDRSLAKLLAQYPGNRNLDEVLLKAAALNSMYVTNIYLIFDMAAHIHHLDIDDILQVGSPGLVDRIADALIGGKHRRCYSFAAKYCAWHRPDAYPIFDSYVEQALWDYGKQDCFADFRRSDLWVYPLFKGILTDFRAYYRLTDFTFKELDKFLWGYGGGLR